MKQISKSTFGSVVLKIEIILVGIFFVTSLLLATGTPAGTKIYSRTVATFTSKTGANIDTVYSNIVLISVAQHASINISPSAGTVLTSSDSTNTDFAITLTNSGNGADVLILSSTSSKGWTRQIYTDANGDGILQQTEINAGVISQTNSLAADGNYKVILRVKIPRDQALNGQKDSTIVKVSSQFNSAQFNQGTFVSSVQTANLVSIGSGLSVNISSPNAGENIIYTFTFTNSGNVPANNVVVSNILNSNLTQISNSTTQGTATGTGNSLSWNIGTIQPTGTVTITVTAQVNTGLLPATIINNQMNVSYVVSANSYSSNSNNVQVTVGNGSAYGVNVTPFTTVVTKDEGDTAVFRFRITNTGVYKDLFELKYSSSQSNTYSFFRDANNNSIWDASDPPLTNTNNFAGIDVDTVAAGDSVRIFAVAVLPRLSLDQIRDTLLLTATSNKLSTISSFAKTVTLINAPHVSSSLTVFPIGNQPAGTTLTYTIAYANSGSAKVNEFSIIDEEPNFTNYIPNSTKINGISRDDNRGPVVISTNTQGKTVITVNIGSLDGKTTGSVEFKMKVK